MWGRGGGGEYVGYLCYYDSLTLSRYLRHIVTKANDDPGSETTQNYRNKAHTQKKEAWKKVNDKKERRGPSNRRNALRWGRGKRNRQRTTYTNATKRPQNYRPHQHIVDIVGHRKYTEPT